tara:strand:- start:703 stop:1023 length:321 start_codon:yes stop_codon:yes gene_type:complete
MIPLKDTLRDKGTVAAFEDYVGNLFYEVEMNLKLFERTGKMYLMLQAISSHVDFFTRLDEFRESGYVPEGTVNRDNLDVLDEYRNMDLTDPNFSTFREDCNYLLEG